jgi:hypothetical protein
MSGAATPAAIAKEIKSRTGLFIFIVLYLSKASMLIRGTFEPNE